LRQQERGRDYSHVGSRADSLQLSVERDRDRLEPRKVSLRVGGVAYRMIGIEKAGKIDVSANVLDDRIRGVPPRSDCHVAIRQGEAVEGGRISALDHFEAGPSRRIEGRSISDAHPSEIGAQGAGERVEPFRPQVLDLSAQRAAGAGIDTERSRSLRLMMQQVPGDLIEQYLRIGRGGRSRTERSAARQ